MHGGNLMVATPLKKNAKYLLKIASFLTFSYFHDV